MKMPARTHVYCFSFLLMATVFCNTVGHAADAPPADDLQIEISTKGLGKEVIITRGTQEWFMLIEVTPENTVVVRQEKDHDRYLVDESETHDRPMTTGEVDAAISDYVNSVTTRAKKK
jgi:hypothetical protein